MERASETVTAPEEKPTASVSKLTGWWSSSTQFLRDTRAEMRQVTWPARQEVYETTLVVIAVVVFAGVFLWVADVVVARVLDTILKWLA